MNNTWETVIEWLYILAFVMFGFWGILWLKDWYAWQKKKDKLTREIRERMR